MFAVSGKLILEPWLWRKRRLLRRGPAMSCLAFVVVSDCELLQIPPQFPQQGHLNILEARFSQAGAKDAAKSPMAGAEKKTPPKVKMPKEAKCESQDWKPKVFEGVACLSFFISACAFHQESAIMTFVIRNHQQIVRIVRSCYMVTLLLCEDAFAVFVPGNDVSAWALKGGARSGH